MIKNEAEKILRHKKLTEEVLGMWNVKTKVIQAITGAIGAISKPYRKYLGNIPGNNEFKVLQKNSQTAHCTYTAESANVNVRNV